MCAHRNQKLLTVILTIALLTPLIFSQNGITPVAASSTWWVAPTPPGTGNPGGSCAAPGFNTIHGAIAAAASGDTINVCTGTYTEQLTVGKSLTLQGVRYPHSFSSLPTIAAPSTMTADASGSMDIVEITGASTTAQFTGFIVTGPASTTCAGSTTSPPSFVGIFVRDGATATITSNQILSIRDNPIDDNQCGIGILIGRQQFSTVGYATINRNTVSDYQRVGIVVDNTGSTASIAHNIVTGDPTTSGIAQNGIEVVNGAVATASANTVSGNQCNDIPFGCGPNLLTQTQSGGIVIFAAGSGTTVTGNTLSNNDMGISATSTGGLTVTSNTATNNRYAGIALFDGTYTITSNIIMGPSNVGIATVADVSNTVVTLGSPANTIHTTSTAVLIQSLSGAGLSASINIIAITIKP